MRISDWSSDVCSSDLLAAFRLGKVVIGLQPARGYNIDPVASYHDPALVPPHGYLAFYAWLREAVGVDAVIHMGKHGNMEWLPGKALALSAACFPEAVFGPLRSEEHTSELQSLMRISYAVFCLKKKNRRIT